MDLSKLPKFSQTPQPPPENPPPSGNAMLFCECGAPVAAGSRFCPHCGRKFRGDEAAASLLAEDVHPAEIWITGFLGVIFMLMGMTFAKWAIAKMTGQPFHTMVNWTSGPKSGQEVDYFELQGFSAWTDMGVFLFGLSMLLEAIALIFVLLGKLRLAAVLLALLVTGATFLLNALVVVKLFGAGVLPILSLLAVAFAGFMVMRLWALARVSSVVKATS
jgi:hypothetical protein